MDSRVKELNLLLLYLSGWEEESRNTPGEKIFRSWKGYLFKVLNELESDDLIRQFGKTKSVVLTATGLAEAKKLKQRYMS